MATFAGPGKVKLYTWTFISLNHPLLLQYAICLMIILAVEIAAAIFAGVNRNNVRSSKINNFSVMPKDRQF